MATKKNVSVVSSIPHQLVEIPFDDPRLTQNTLTESLNEGEPGFHARNGIRYFRPQVYKPGGYIAWHSFQGEEIADFLGAFGERLCIICGVNSESESIPASGQRRVTSQRIGGICTAWGDSRRTPQYKTEDIHVMLFGAEVCEHGIMLDDELVAAIWDGAGRVSSAMYLCHRGSSLLKDRDIAFHVTFRLTGDKLETFQSFQADNNGKRVTPGTKLSNGIATIETIESGRGELDLSTMLSPHAIPFILREVFSRPKSDSIACLMPWELEGVKSASSQFYGPGKATSLATALQQKMIGKIIRNNGYEVEDLPEIIDFTFRQHYQMAPEAVEAAMRVAADRSKASHRDKSLRIYSRLAIEFILVMGLRIWRKSGPSVKRFREYTNDILDCYLATYPEEFSNSKRKRLTMDNFWAENTFFNDTKFNSGAMNSQRVLKHLDRAIDLALGNIEDEAA